VSLREKKLDDAALLLERGLELAAETRNRYQEIRALVYLAFTKLEEGEPADKVRSGALELARSATRLAREAEIANGEAYGLCAEALALERANDLGEALARARMAVALVDSGRDVDCPEEILYLLWRVAERAGERQSARDALRRSFIEVQRKARRLHDNAWRARYLGAPPAREILAAARLVGVDAEPSDGNDAA
jgi:hypothetical protein